MTPRLARLCLAVASSGLLSDAWAQNPPPLPTNPAPPALGAAPAASSDEELVQLKLPDADIDTVLSALEIYTGRIILRPQQLQTSTYNLKIAKPIPKSEAILAIETVLALNRIGIAPLGDRFLKVVDLQNVKMEAPEMISGSALDRPASGKVATKIFQLEFIRVGELVPMLQQGILNPFYGGPVQLQNANALLLTDSVSNLQRVELLLQQLDRPVSAGMKPKFYTLKNGAKASDLVNKLRTILQGTLQNQLGQATTYSADDRTNQIIVVTDPRQWDFFSELIDRLDQKSDPNTRTEVLYLKHAKSADVVKVLTYIINGQTTVMQRANPGSVRPGTIAAPVPPPVPGAPPAPVPANIVSGTSAGNLNLDAGGANEFSALMTVVSDERSNSVVVFGTSDDIRLVQTLVDKLDIVLKQVRIEVVVVEVSLDDAHSSGISQLGLQVSGDKLIGFSGGVPGLSINGTGDSGFATITRPDGTNSVSGPWDLAGIITIGTTPRKNNTTVLSTPSVTTSHATKATFISSEKRPITTGTTQTPIGSTNAASGFATSQQVVQQDIGVTLTVTPLIGTDNTVQMDVDQDVQDVAGTVKVNGDDQPIISHRQIKSFITARSGDIIVLGGMQRNKDSRQTNRLGPIPIIGDLLGSRTKAVTRTELIFFLRPYVLVNSQTDNAEMLKRIQELPPKDVPQKDEIRKVLEPGFVPPKKSVLDKILPK